MKKIILLSLLILVGLALAFTQVGPLVHAVIAAPAADGLEITKTPKNQAGKSEKAAKAAKRGGQKTNLKGVVASFDGSALVLTLKDQSTLSVAVDDATQVSFAGPKGLTAPDLLPGDAVMVQAVKDGGALLALQVRVIPGEPTRVHRVGTVTEYAPWTSITIVEPQGAQSTFSMSTDTKILPESRKGELQVGARVTIISPRRPAGEPPVAQGIVVHPGTK